MKIVAIVTARMTSKRLPGKTLMKIIGKPIIELLIQRLSYSKKINQIVLEVKLQSNKFDKNYIERIINFREIRFSKYCAGINLMQKNFNL